MSQTACKLSPEPKVRPKIQLLQSGAGSKSGTFGPLGKKIIIGTQDFINSWNIKKKFATITQQLIDFTKSAISTEKSS